MRVDVALLPPSEPPRGRTCLVVDVLRATSVMAVLFGRGLRRLYPAPGIEEARALRDELAVTTRSRPLLIGEVNALPPEGFDCGNSPTEFASMDPLPDSAVIATTNGTTALLACREAALVLAAAPLNASAAVRGAVEAGHDVLVVCAGLRGAPADDDLLAAGLLVERLVRAGGEPGAEARLALDRYEAARHDLAGAFRATEHGARLVELGFAADLDLAATPDRYDVAAALDRDGSPPVLRPLGREEAR